MPVIRLVGIEQELRGAAEILEDRVVPVFAPVEPDRPAGRGIAARGEIDGALIVHDVPQRQTVSASRLGRGEDRGRHHHSPQNARNMHGRMLALPWQGIAGWNDVDQETRHSVGGGSPSRIPTSRGAAPDCVHLDACSSDRRAAARAGLLRSYGTCCCSQSSAGCGVHDTADCLQPRPVQYVAQAAINASGGTTANRCLSGTETAVPIPHVKEFA